MDNNLSVLSTIQYSDIFDFPVTEEEIWQYLIATKPLTKKQIHTALQKLQAREISYEAPYYCLHGRERIIRIRRKRQIASVKKLTQTETLTKMFALIPTLRYVGISGSLARMNANKNDDIDLFVITEARTVWITRLLLLFLLQLQGKRRKRGEEHVKDKMCLNFLLDIDHMHFAKDRHDIYTAYEIAQLKSIYDRSHTYNQFIHANNWTKKFLPHLLPQPNILKEKKHVSVSLVCFLGSLLEPAARYLQLLIMRKHQTAEVVSKGVAAFHPHNYRQVVLQQFAHLASKKPLVASEKPSLWDIDKAPPIIYTRKDCTISPNIPLERFSFKNL